MLEIEYFFGGRGTGKRRQTSDFDSAVLIPYFHILDFANGGKEVSTSKLKISSAQMATEVPSAEDWLKTFNNDERNVNLHWSESGL